MIRGFSLTEVLVGLLIGFISIGALLNILRLGVDTHLDNKHTQRSHSNLEFAADELDDTLVFRELGFWDTFQRNTGMLHNVSSIKRSISLTQDCPDESDSCCLIYFDLLPAKEQRIYQVISFDYPYRLTLDSLDATDPPGPGEEVEPMGVMLFSAVGIEFCALIADIVSGEIVLASLESQPWILPQSIGSTNMEAVYLGKLKVTHVGLKEIQGGGQRLIYRPWGLVSGEWTKQRSRSSFQHLGLFEFIEEAEGGPLLRLHKEEDNGNKLQEVHYVTVQ